MSLYNLIMGYNPGCILLLPMLGRKHDEYPRFRDCFLSDDGNAIVIYTRVGGGNRGCGYGEEELYKDANFLRTYDDDFDETYGYYEFAVPGEWKSDFDAIVNGNIKDVSQKYIDLVKTFYPDMAKNGDIDKIFKKETR